MIKKSLYTWRLYCNHQVHRDSLITLYKHSPFKHLSWYATGNFNTINTTPLGHKAGRLLQQQHPVSESEPCFTVGYCIEDASVINTPFVSIHSQSQVQCNSFLFCQYIAVLFCMYCTLSATILIWMNVLPLGIQSIILILILRLSRMGTVSFYTSTSNKRAARPKLYTESLTRDLKRVYSRLTLVRISINL